MVGAMMKAVRNIARLIMTELGGVCWMPMAVRRNDRTTAIRMKAVTITRMPGAMDSTVSSAKSWMICDVLDPPARLRSKLKLWADAGFAISHTIRPTSGAM